jgi:hypothetical protein
MAAKTFLELVNRALLESKVTLDPLTSVNFAAPSGSIMYDHFKTWVNTAYEELALARPDWHFQQERATVPVYPRLQLAGLSGTITAGDVQEGATSGVRFTVVAVHTFEDVEPAGGEVTVSVDYTDPTKASDLILLEQFNEITPTPTSNVAYLKGWGFYDFRNLIPDVKYIVQDSVTLNRTVADALADDDNHSYPVVLLPWDKFNTAYPYRWVDNYFGVSQAIAQTPQGSFELYPRIDKAYLLSFDYTRVHTPMVLFSDTPSVMPDQYHLYIMWKAVLEYADFDGNGKLFNRATKHINEYRYWLERDEMPRPTMIATGFRVCN